MNTSLHFSSAKHDWTTPQDFFDILDREFKFDLDASASPENAKCPKWLGPGSPLAQDGLSAPWSHHGFSVFCNPEYKNAGAWVQKGYEESLWGVTSVLLVPARSCTRWFHDWAVKGELRFVRGRLKFGGAQNAAPFPSLVIVFRPKLAVTPWAIR